MKKLFVSSCVALCAAFVHAETFVWTGAEDAYWTNAANWTVSGAAASRCPGAVKMADTDAMWTAMDADTDTAVFDGTGVNPAVGYIDLDGHLSVKNVIFRGADAPAYVFGKTSSTPSSVNAQRLALPPSGTLTLEATLGTAPVMTTGLCIVQGGQANTAATAIQLVNNSAVEFDLGPHWGQPMRRTAVNPNMYVKFSGSGAGGFAMGAHDIDGDYFNYFTFSQLGPVRVYGNIGTASGFTVNKADGTEMTFNVEKNGVVYMKQHGWATFTATTSARFTGAGIFRTYDASSGTVTPTWSISSGKAVTIDCQFVLVNGGGQFWNLNGSSGKIVFTADMPNTSYTKSVQLRGGTLETAKVGRTDEGSPLGTGAFFFGNTSRLAYTGAGETGDRTLFLTNFAASAGATTGRLSQRGTGAWTVGGVSDLSWSGKANTLYLENDTEFEAKIARALVEGAGTLAVVKTGAGKWTVSGANAYTGATTLEGGTLALDATQTIASLVVNGDAALAIADGATVTVSSLTHTKGTLDIKTTGTGKLIVNGAAFGAAEAWLTVNGGAANVQADGTITAADHTWTSNLNIPARGGVIPTTATDADVVGITTDGTGDKPITLEAEAGATIKGLVQKTAADATVSLAEGQTLTTGLLAIEPTAGSLTIGLPDVALAESGAFAVSGTKLTLDVGNADETLFINAPFDKTGKTLAKTGDGAAEVVLAGGETATGSIAEGTLAFTNGNSAVVLASGEEGFANFEQALSADGTLFTTKWVAGSSAPLVVGGATGVGQTNVINAQNGRIDILGSNTFLRASLINARPIDDNANTSTVVIADGAYVALDENSVVNVSGRDRGSGSEAKYKKGWGELIVSNATLATSKMPTDYWHNMDHGVFLGNDWGPGVMRVYDSVITNRIRIGRWSWYGFPEIGTGAYYQYGGKAHVWAQVGVGRYGYMELNDVTVTLQSLQVGTFNANGGDYRGSGVLFVNGGSVYGYSIEIGSANNTASAFQSALYLARGSVHPYNTFFMGNPGSENTRINVTVAGGAFKTYYARPFGTAPIYVNMNGGTYTTANFYETKSATTPYYFNFNGGTYKLSSGYGGVISFNEDHVTRLTVYEKGMTYDADESRNDTISGSFKSAPGKGVAAIPLTDAVRNRRFIGSPTVHIDGDGEGASAYALFDSLSGAVTNIVVTSHGWNYTAATATVKIYYNFPNA